MKKGLSNIIATVLMVLLVVVSVGFLAVVIINLNQSSLVSISEYEKEIIAQISDGRDTAIVNESDSAEYILTYWGPYIDSQDMESGDKWNQTLSMMRNLSEIGFTHTGINLYNNAKVLNSPEKFQPRINDLRNIGLPLAILHEPGYPYLINYSLLDGENHSSNQHDIKYFDAYGFDPYVCASTNDPLHPDWCESPLDIKGTHCSLEPSKLSLDPRYNGNVWQMELNLLSNILSNFSVRTGDVVLLDIEVWGSSPEYADGSTANACYPGALQNSAGIYTGSLFEKQTQYYQFWKARGRDTLNIVKEKADVKTLFYHEEILKYSNLSDLQSFNTWIPSGTGDAPSPRFYVLPNLTLFENKLNSADYSGSYVWVSFSKKPGGVYSLDWDPKITQKAGYLSRLENISGIIEFPGPESDIYGYEHYLSHSRAFMLGFVDGINPGVLAEVCFDGMDNDGDLEIDEGCT